MHPISVNEAIDRLPNLEGQSVTLVGSLCLEFEGQCISHIPKSESRDDGFGEISSSIWVEFDLNQIKEGERWLTQFDGRHVKVTGTLSGSDPLGEGCGHFDMWPAELLVTAIEKKRISAKRKI